MVNVVAGCKTFSRLGGGRRAEEVTYGRFHQSFLLLLFFDNSDMY